MVHLDLEQGSEPALRVTCELAARFKARVIGVTAGLPAAAIHADGMIASSVLEVDYEQLNQAIGRCESRFRSALKGFSVTGMALGCRQSRRLPCGRSSGRGFAGGRPL
jgi:hypothetical protein